MALLVVGCTCGQPDEIPEEGPPPTAAELESFARSTNELGWRVYSRLPADDQPNVVYSPFSTHVALAMFELGSDGSTKRELLRVLNQGQPERSLRRAGSTTLRRWLIPDDGPSPVVVRSRIFVDRRVGLRERFVSALQADFGARIEALDFTSGAESEIAEWMREGHAGAPRVSLGPDVRLVAVNQLRFAGRWAEPFEPNATSDQVFHREAAPPVEVPTMWLSAELPYATVEGARCVELAYQDDRFGLLLVRPEGDDPLDTLEPSARQLAAWVSALEPTELELRLPRFAVDGGVGDLSEALIALGLTEPFDRTRANFDRMRDDPEPLAIGAIMQAAEIEVDEHGTRAAATTVATTVVASAAPDRVVLRFDRPFLFVLRERETGIALFIGRVGDPSPDRPER